MGKSHQASQWTNRGMGSILMCKEAHCDLKKCKSLISLRLEIGPKGLESPL